MQVKIPFLEEFKTVMLDGTKTWTSRNKRYGDPGDWFRVFGHDFRILKVEKRVLWDIANHYTEEGCKSRRAFIKLWRRIHFILGWTPDKRVHVHVFKRISI